MKKRVFVPARKYVGHTNIRTAVDCWEWTRSGGLRVFYTDGLSARSDYSSLPEMLKAESPIELRFDVKTGVL